METKLLLLLVLVRLVTYSQNLNITYNVPTNGLFAYYPFCGNHSHATVNGATLTTDKAGLPQVQRS